MSETGKTNLKRRLNIKLLRRMDNTDQEYEGESANQ